MMGNLPWHCRRFDDVFMANRKVLSVEKRNNALYDLQLVLDRMDHDRSCS